jgi:Fur family transcriptional regulator, ferric uptake regulator
MSETSPDDNWLVRLQSGGYRLTAPIRVLVEIISRSERILDPLELFDLGRKTYPQMGLVTVYRTLEKLEEIGLVQRVHQANNCHGYLRAANGHEHILLCTNCGRVEYFTGDDLSGLFEQVAQKSKFQIKEHWLQLHGLCEACQL